VEPMRALVVMLYGLIFAAIGYSWRIKKHRR
jgi:hypothetical protein